MRPYYAIVILAMGAVTYATRVGFIGVARQFELHPLLRKSLEYVPVSILAALIFPTVLAPSGHFVSPLTNVYVWAACLTALALVTLRRSWIAIALGVVGLVVARRFLGM